jgi:WS/DGAT/MGAT family acyltransferase
VKTIGRARGGTVNDVLVSAVAGGLRRYLHGRGESVDGLSFRAIIPVNLRPISAEPDPGNRFGFVFLTMPVGLVGADERLQTLSRRMDALKDSLEAPVAFGVLHVIGLVPTGLQDTAVRLFGAKCTVVITNVIGPREEISLAGAPIESMMFWVPQSARLGIGVSIFSYDGCVHLGVATDEGLVPDPEEIVAGFQAEFDMLLEAAREEDTAARLAEMTAGLDRASASLDALLEAKAAPVAPEGPLPERCQALTKAGKPCKNRALEGSAHCRVHQES